MYFQTEQRNHCENITNEVPRAKTNNVVSEQV